jgi:hypothetical protein
MQSQKDFVFFHVKNDVGGRRGNFFFDLRPLGVLSGVSDFVFLLPGGKVAFLEIKADKGKLSHNQKSFIANARKLGHNVSVTYGWEQTLSKATAIVSLAT